MSDSRRGAGPDGFPRDEGQDSDGVRGAGWVPELVLSGLALILPAVTFMAAASVFYAPAARAMAPIAIGLTFVGFGLVLFGYVLRRR